ncbi:hypothetical protein [Streptomyces sp. NPDC058268]|uniref:hypothetical protein n=1 Tax=Streptomyces sp. NPDC058268 TaxID=3346413 RepID=UPI0036E82E52
MPDNPHQVTLQRLLILHQEDLADLRTQALRLREMLHRRPPRPDASPKPPPSRAALQRDLAGIERAISKHEQIIGFGDDERVGEMLQAIANDLDLARQAADAPHAFAARWGLELPATLVIDPLIVGSEVSARVRNLDPDMPFEITWTQDGFQAPAESAASRSGDIAEHA